MAAGTPIVGPNVGGISETVSHGETGLLVEANDSNAFAQAVESLLDSELRRATFGQNGPTRVESHYTVERQWTAMLELYEQAMQSSVRPYHSNVLVG